MEDAYDLVVVGGGAAGFFGAIQTAEFNPRLSIILLEKSNKVLSKVRISGGGRCNVTHHCLEPTPLSHHYPRGQKELKKLFRVFQAKDTINWFELKGVKLKTEADGRMFPVTDQSQTIIDCFMNEARQKQIRVELNCGVQRIEKNDKEVFVHCAGNRKFRAKRVLIAVGGYAREEMFEWLKAIGHTILPPIPSLFTFNAAEKNFKDLMGVAVDKAEVKIEGTRFAQSGAVLITHWGLSGPAVIKLSAWAAEHLHRVKYTFTALINWVDGMPEDRARDFLLKHQKEHSKQRVCSHALFGLPVRLWMKLCEMSQVEDKRIWAELPRKSLNRLVENLIRCRVEIKGKTTFKEEFVTCGGIALSEIDLSTMESKKMHGIYFAGEVLNIDGETGGFNFQSAWTTAFVAARAIAQYKVAF